MSPRNFKAERSLMKSAKAGGTTRIPPQRLVQPIVPKPDQKTTCDNDNIVVSGASTGTTTTLNTSTDTTTNQDSGVTPLSSTWFVNELPNELQVRILSYLRAHELSKVHQVNRYMAQTKQLHHDIVIYCAEQVYPPKWTEGFQYQPTTCSNNTFIIPPSDTIINSSSTKNIKGKVMKGKPRSGSFGSLEEDVIAIRNRAAKSRSSSLGSIDDNASTTDITIQNNVNTTNDGNITTTTGGCELSTLLQSQPLYTFEHLRNMELLVVARVLNSPEPATGYVVSKSWCKTALLWLEGQQERRYEQHQQALQAAAFESGGSSKNKKKIVKKMKVKSNRKSISATTPPPNNINSDITCAHNQLQHCTSTKSVRARRRLLDKQAWKILKALYPESTPIPAQSGECIQCIAEACQMQKMEQDQQEALKEQRKLPLQNPHIRRFYTRTRGVPELCIRTRSGSDVDVRMNTVGTEKEECPLIDGTYYVLPRSWCHGWRRYMKTGEGSAVVNHTNGTTTFSPPDASCLLCDAHRLALLPPHLEAFLYGESVHLFDSSSSYNCNAANLGKLGNDMASLAVATVHNDTVEHQYPLIPPGQGPTLESILAMRSLGLSENEIGRQLSALRVIEARNERQNTTDDTNNAISRNELLDQENYHVVEILSETEFRNLLGCWSASTSVYVLRFIVHLGVVTTIAATTERDSLLIGSGQEEASRADFCISVCRNCDATGRFHCVKGKQRCSRSNNSSSWNNKKHHNASHDRSRTTTSLEY